MIERPPSGYLSENSEFYQESRKEARKVHMSDATPFGDTALGYIDYCRAKLGETISATEQEQYEKEIAKELEKIRQGLMEKLQSPRGIRSILNLFDEAFADKMLGQKIESELPAAEADEEVVIRAAKEFVRGGLSDAVLEEILRIHREEFEKKREAFEKMLPDFEARFSSSVDSAIESGYIRVSKEQVRRRMEENKVELVDSLNANLQEEGGDYDLASARIRISSSASQTDWYRFYVHEEIHALSGRTILFEDRGRSPRMDIKHPRMGLRFGGTEDQRRVELNWLNEAVAETLTIHLVGEEREDIYKDDRELLNELIGRGLSREIVYDAFFENYDPDGAEKVPGWQALVGQLKNVFPEGVAFLEELG